MKNREQWEQDVGFQSTWEVLEEVHATLEQAGVPLLFVFVPSKAQVLLPAAERDAEAFYAMATFGQQAPDVDPEQFAWDFHAITLAYHYFSRLIRDPEAEDRARNSFQNLIRASRA